MEEIKNAVAKVIGVFWAVVDKGIALVYAMLDTLKAHVDDPDKLVRTALLFAIALDIILVGKLQVISFGVAQAGGIAKEAMAIIAAITWQQLLAIALVLAYVKKK